MDECDPAPEAETRWVSSPVTMGNLEHLLRADERIEEAEESCRRAIETGNARRVGSVEVVGGWGGK
jgi:hypothetical protein